jgi:glutathione peroxidase
MKFFILTLLVVLLSEKVFAAEPQTCPNFLNVEMRKLHSKESVNLCQYYQAGKPMVIVNTASHCGFTKQFGDLEKLYQKYQPKGLVILGFPSNSFKQESASEEDTARVCFKNFGVTFPMFETVDVRGKNAHGVFQYLTKESEKPSWNFNKYLIMNGKVTHFGSKEKPLDSKLEKAIQGIVQ